MSDTSDNDYALRRPPKMKHFVPFIDAQDNNQTSMQLEVDADEDSALVQFTQVQVDNTASGDVDADVTESDGEADNDPVSQYNNGNYDSAEESTESQREDEDEDTAAFSQAIVNTNAGPAAIAPLLPASLADARQTRYTIELQKGYLHFLKPLFEEESPKRSTLFGIKVKQFCDVGWQILAAMHTPILLALVCGNLAEKSAANDPNVRQALDLYEHPFVRKSLPCIYQLVHADASGRGPRVWQWKIIVQEMMEYTRTTTDPIKLQKISNIDRVHHEKATYKQAQDGMRKHLKQDGDETANKKIATIKTFCDAVLQGIAAIEADTSLTTLQKSNTRLTKTYVGYTESTVKRWPTHINKPSNYILGLAVAISQVEWPQEFFEIQPFMVSLVREEHEASFGEIIVAAIANCMYETGNGFNIAHAGGSVASFAALSPDRHALVGAWRVKHSPYGANQVAQTKLIERRQQLADNIAKGEREAADKRQKIVALREQLEQKRLRSEIALYESLKESKSKVISIIKEDLAREQ
jgi:hypothetical protein